jgi:sporulation protein YlmC with PRC-barrel domain
MLKPIAIAALLATFGSAAAYAQTTPPASPATPPLAHQDATMAHHDMQATADTAKLIGRNVKNPQGDTIGEIKSIYVNKNGKVAGVMVGVGGFLGVGEREVRLAWKDLNIMDNGEKVTVNMTKDQLKAMAPYKYKDESYRGKMFSDNGVWAADHATTMTSTTAPSTPTVSTGDFNADGQMSANAIIGASVKNSNNDTVGKVQDAYLDNSGEIKEIIVSVGGFLGVGTKNVAVHWSDIKFSRSDNSVVLKTNWTKDSLKAMPDYKYERRVPAPTAG